MFRKLLLKAAVALALLLGLLSFTAFPRLHVAAAPAPVTYGDVQRLLYGNGGNMALNLHAHQFVGSVPHAEIFTRAAITPLSSHNGEGKCVDDWHLIRLTLINVVDGVFFSTKEQAVADLQATTVVFTLDGVPVPITETPITQVNVTDQQLLGFPGTTVSFQAGSILAPDALGVGTHTAGVTITDPVFGFFQDASTFTVDPAGTGACLLG